ncbi:MAG: hypothetical protein DWQ34_22285 [Planctomycetota bacterium]|nr:MAG: hypothetical protein DWQ34_22285 [Planctomycetota bacterium]
MSFNLRYGTADDGENSWSQRRQIAIQTIREYGPDLLATQEALAEQVDDLREQLPDYAVEAVGREDGRRRGEATAVFFRRNRFELCEREHFWLSETPEVPGSISWDASQTRMVTVCRLRLQESPAREILFFNTHFDNRSERARLESARLLRERITEAALHDPVIVAGDFNATEAEPVYRILLNGEHPGSTLVDSYRAAHPEHNGEELTRHDFRGERKGSRIDWILHSPHFITQAAAIDRREFDGRYPSDHYPVTAELAFT